MNLIGNHDFLALLAVVLLYESMKRTAQDPTKKITVSRRETAKAYYRWLEKRGRAARDSGKHSDKLFVQEVYRRLDLAQDDAPTSLGIPTVRSGWWNWANGHCVTDSKRIRLDVCRAIKSVTQCDITGNKELTIEPDNATDLVRIGPAHQKTSSAGETEILLDYINFRVSSAKDVTRDATTSRPKGRDYEERIGTVRYVLHEASVFVSGNSNLKPAAKLIRSSDRNDVVELSIDRDDWLRFRAAHQEEDKPLKGDIEGISLAKGTHELGREVMVSISIARNDIKPIFEIAQSKRVSVEGEERARTELIEQVLLNRIPDEGPRKRYVVAQTIAVAE